MKITHIFSKNGTINYARRVNGKKIWGKVTDFEWYFYVKKVDITSQHLDDVKKYLNKVVTGKEYIRIYCENLDYGKFDHEKGKYDARHYVVRYFLQKGIQTYEADLPLYKRWMIDNKVEIEEDIKIGYLDIETDDRVGTIEIGRDQILSFSIRIDGKSYFHTDTDESVLLNLLAKYIDAVDVVCTWNGDNFDIPYILQRFYLYNIKMWKRDFVHFDLMTIFKKRYKFKDGDNPITNFNLENISRILLGRGKVRHTEKIWDLFVNYHAKKDTKLKDYNIVDVELLDGIDEKVGITSNIRGMCAISKCPYRDFYISEVIDYFIMTEAKTHNRILPSCQYKLEESSEESLKKKYAGAFVFDVKPGLYKDVAVFDFSSQYPSTIRTFNIGIDTYLGPSPVPGAIKTINGQYFDRNKKSTVAIACEKMVEERAKTRTQMKGMDESTMEWKALNNKQEVYKVLANSCYGAIGSTYTRYYNKDLAEAVTLSARHMIETVIEWTSKMGYMTVLSDTDSIALSMNGDSYVGLNDKIMGMLKDYLEKEFNILEFPIKLSFDKYFKQLLIVAKKNYVYVNPNDKMDAKGLEFLKSDTCKYAAHIQKDMLTRILINGETDYNRIISKYKEEYDNIIVTKSNIDDFVIFERVTRNPKNYTSTSPAISVAKKMIDDGKLFYPGILVGYVITGKLANKITGVSVDEFDGTIDKSYIWDRQILPKLTRILEVLEPSTDWEQYSNSIVSTRNSRIQHYKIEMFSLDKSSKVLERINNDKVLCANDKRELMEFYNNNRFHGF